MAKRSRTSAPATVGGIVAGFEYDVWKRQPPPHELVRKAQALRGLAADGTDLTVELPSDAGPTPTASTLARVPDTWPPPAAVFLDLDGLAVDSEPLHLLAATRALAEFGVEFDPETMRPYFGQPTEVSTRAIAALHRLDPMVLLDRRSRHFAALIAEGVPFRPHLVEAARVLTSAGLSLGLVSSGLRTNVDRAATAMRDAGIALDVVIAREDVERPKPDPEPYLRAAALLRLHPAGAVVFEDAPSGLQSALAAGMRCIIVPNEHTTGGPFDGATAVVSDLVAAAAWVVAQVDAPA